MSDINPELISGGDTRLHYHLEDRVTNGQLQAAMRVGTVTGNYTLTDKDDIIKVTATATITLPRAKSGREYELIIYAAGVTLTVVPTGTDTIMGTTSLVAYARYTALHLKALSSDWVLI